MDLGCGNGFMANQLAGVGFKVVGTDPSASGIDVARTAYPNIQFEQADAYDLLADRFGKFDLVISIEVIEHCADPASFCRTARSLIKPGGMFILTTPYHGYVKNLALSVFNRWDTHMNPAWVGGHVKLFSCKSLTDMLKREGFDNISIHRIGRIPPVAMTMMAICKI